MAPDRRAVAGRRPGLAGADPRRPARAPRALPRPRQPGPARRPPRGRDGHRSTAPGCGPGWRRGACCCPTSTCRGSSTCVPERDAPAAHRAVRRAAHDQPAALASRSRAACSPGARACPWVADWRDPWLANPDVTGRPPRGAGQAGGRRRVLARRAAPRMAGAACVNEAIADEVRRPRARRAGRGDPERRRGGADRRARAPSRPAPDVPVHAGYFFGDRGPGVFLDRARGALCGSGPRLPRRVRARFVGGVSRRRARRARRARARRRRLDGADAAARRGAAGRSATPTCCCCSCRTRAGAEAVVPAKTWEYLAAEPARARAGAAGRRRGARARRGRRRRDGGAGRRGDGVRARILRAGRPPRGRDARGAGPQPGARERISRRGAGRRNSAALLRRGSAADDQSTRAPSAAAPGDGVEQPVVSRRDGRRARPARGRAPRSGASPGAGRPR